MKIYPGAVWHVFVALAFATFAARADLPGVAAERLEQAPKPNPAAPKYRQK